MVFDPKIIDDIAKGLSDAMPESVRQIQADMQEKFRSLLQASFAKLDLVTREEFDVQVKVLANTRAKVEALEHRLAELDRKITTAEPSNPEE